MNERLQKLIAAAGIASRRKAEDLIVAGAVTVNGKVVVELGAKADPEKDHIKVSGKLLNPQLARNEKVYVLLNKPTGYLTSTSDPQGRPLVIDLIGRYRKKLHPVGRSNGLRAHAIGIVLPCRAGSRSGGETRSRPYGWTPTRPCWPWRIACTPRASGACTTSAAASGATSPR